MISIVGCFEPLGIQAGEFNDGEIAASSMSKNFSSTDAWCPPKVDENQYIQVDLSRKTELTKIATQGESGSKDRFVKTFSLLYSDNGKKWEQYGDKKAEKVRGKQDHAKKSGGFYQFLSSQTKANRPLPSLPTKPNVIEEQTPH